MTDASTDRALDAKAPTGPDRRAVDAPTSSTPSWSTRPTSAATRSSSSAPGLAGAAAAATLAELGYQVKAFTFHDSPRRAHSIAAQGGINAAKNYRGDGDSIYRLFYDTVKGGDFRSRESQRLPAGRGVGEHHRPVRRPGRALRPRVRRPARQPLLRRRAGVAHVLRPGPDRPAAAARRLPGAGPRDRPRQRRAVQPLRAGRRRRGRRRLRRHRHPRPADRRDHVPLRPRRPCSRPAATPTSFFLSTNAMACNVTAIWRAHRRGALLRQPVLHADPPDVHPAERRVPVEAHADVGVAAQRRADLGAEGRRRRRGRRARSPRTTATTTWSGCTRASATWPPATSPAGPPSGPWTAAGASAR